MTKSRSCDISIVSLFKRQKTSRFIVLHDAVRNLHIYNVLLKSRLTIKFAEGWCHQCIRPTGRLRRQLPIASRLASLINVYTFEFCAINDETYPHTCLNLINKLISVFGDNISDMSQRLQKDKF